MGDAPWVNAQRKPMGFWKTKGGVTVTQERDVLADLSKAIIWSSKG
jgi:hypothetical protein